MREHDRTAIHEAMEQQTISVAKAGLVCKLNARSTIIAVTNPKGSYDTTEDVSVNTAIASPLLSRFDIVLVLPDRMEKEWDRVVSTFVLKEAESGAEASQNKNWVWPLDKLRKYIGFVKERFKPRMTEEVMQVLQSYYQVRRTTSKHASALALRNLCEFWVVWYSESTRRPTSRFILNFLSIYDM